MGRHSTPRLYLTFAAGVVLALLLAGAVLFYVRFESIAKQAELDAATTATDTIAPLVGQASLDDAAGSLDGHIRALRLWSGEGELLDARGTSGEGAANGVALQEALQGETASFKAETPEGNAQLVSYAPLGDGTVLEIRQRYEPIAESIAASRSDLFVTAGGLGLALILLLPIGLWAALRTLTDEHRKLLYLYKTGQAIRSTLDLTNVLEQLARDAATLVKAQLAVCTIVEEKSNDLVVEASYDRETDATTQHRRKIEEWFIRRCAATGQSVEVELAEFPYIPVLGHEPTHVGPFHVLSLAIPGHERPIGVVTVVRKKSKGALSASEVHVLQEVAAQAAMAVEQALLFSKLRRYADEVELSYDTTLKVLMAAIDTKDSDTQGHSERVSRFAVALAREMNVPDESLVDIERGALLHDVGKIGVPDEILRKPASLNEKEWEAMQKHPLLAGLMVSKVGFLERALPILLYHHERFDGKGYPFGLEGTSIPLEARIFAVVDSYDAMTSDRPYRKAMPVEEALEELKHHAGSQFDPHIVEAFSRVVARMERRPRKAA